MTEVVSARRVALITTVVGAASLFLGGVTLWRWMPGRALAADAVRYTGEYTPPDSIPVVLPEADLRGLRVAVVEAGESEVMTGPGVYAREARRWREWLAEAGAERVAAERAQVLVLPLAECMDNDVRGLLERHLRKGGGVVTTGLVGARTGGCGPAPDTVLTALLGGGGEGPRFVRAEAARSHVVLLGETMLSAGLPAGARLDLDPTSHLVFRGPEREAYFATFERKPVVEGGEAYFDGAAARAVAGAGRVVAFGFGMGEVQRGWSERVAKKMVENAVRWAAGRPVVQLAHWPGQHEAAAVVAQDVESDYANAAGAIRVIEEEEIPTTYFIVGSLAEQHPFITRDMVRTGELASHSYSHLPMDGFTTAGLREELRRSKSSADDFVERPIRGFRPPEERFTIETLEAWAEVGGDYFFARDHARVAAPVIVPIGPDSLVFLGRVTDDDFEILTRYELRDRSAMTATLVSEIEEVIGYRGAYLFSYHSHLFSQAKLLPVLEEVAEALKARPEIWLTTAGELALWWRTRAAVEVAVADDGLSAELRNLGDATYSDGALLVDLPTGDRSRIVVPDLAPGEAVRINFEF